MNTATSSQKRMMHILLSNPRPTNNTATFNQKHTIGIKMCIANYTKKHITIRLHLVEQQKPMSIFSESCPFAEECDNLLAMSDEELSLCAILGVG